VEKPLSAPGSKSIPSKTNMSIIRCRESRRIQVNGGRPALEAPIETHGEGLGPNKIYCVINHVKALKQAGERIRLSKHQKKKKKKKKHTKLEKSKGTENYS